MSKHFRINAIYHVGILIGQEMSSISKILFHILISYNLKKNPNRGKNPQTSLATFYRNAKNPQSIRKYNVHKTGVRMSIY